MGAEASTMWSLEALAVMERLEVGITPTMEKIAEEGFQHLEQPQAWLWRTFEESETATFSEGQWQERVPPEKDSEPFFNPLSMRGWSLKDMIDS